MTSKELWIWPKAILIYCGPKPRADDTPPHKNRNTLLVQLSVASLCIDQQIEGVAVASGKATWGRLVGNEGMPLGDFDITDTQGIGKGLLSTTNIVAGQLITIALHFNAPVAALEGKQP